MERKHVYPVPQQAYAGYPVAAPIPLDVELVLTNELLAARWQQSLWGFTSEIPLGDVLAKNAEALARATFANVSVSRGYSLQASPVAAVLTPRLVAVDKTTPSWAWQDATLTLVLEWRLEARGGPLLWLDTVTGSGTRAAGNVFTRDERAEERVAAAINEVFLASSEALRKSPEIGRFAARGAPP